MHKDVKNLQGGQLASEKNYWGGVRWGEYMHYLDCGDGFTCIHLAEVITVNNTALYI